MERTHLAKVSLLAVSILLHLGTSSSLHSDRQPSGLSNVLFSLRITLEDILAEILFPTRDQCMSVMCAPRISRCFPWTCGGYGLATYGLSEYQPPTVGEFPTPNFQYFLDLEAARNVLGVDSSLIFDDDGQVIGIRPAGDRPAPVGSLLGPGILSGGQGGSLLGGTPAPIPATPKDVDVCCKTIVTYFFNRTMTDVRGEKQTIAHTKEIGSNQLIRHAYCGEHGTCPGQCEIENIYVSLLTVQAEDKQPLKTAWFELPGYCSCRVKKGQNGR